MAKATAAAAAVAIEVASAADVAANVDDTPAILVSSVADVVAIRVSRVEETVAILVAIVLLTAAMRDSKPTEVLAILVAIVADRAAIAVVLPVAIVFTEEIALRLTAILEALAAIEVFASAIARALAAIAEAFTSLTTTLIEVIAAAFVPVNTETPLMRVSIVEDTPAIRVSNVEETVAILVAIVLLTVAIRVSNVAERAVIRLVLTAIDEVLAAIAEAFTAVTRAFTADTSALTAAIRVSNAAETFAIDVCNVSLVLDKVAETVLIWLSKAAEVEARVELTEFMRVSNVADRAATVEDVATGSPPTNIFEASTVVALIVPALTVVANKLPVRKLLTLTSWNTSVPAVKESVVMLVATMFVV